MLFSGRSCDGTGYPFADRPAVQRDRIIAGRIWRFWRQGNLPALAWPQCEPGLGSGVAGLWGDHADTGKTPERDSSGRWILCRQRRPHREGAVTISRLVSSESASDVLTARFREVFGASSCIFRAPGRVNVVGEHTDYNDGFVLPAAIQFYTWVAGEKRGDRVLEVYSEHFDEKISLPLDALAGPHRGHWSDFIRGVAAVLQNARYKLAGANLVAHGEVPLARGLSFSASLEVATALALISLSGFDVPRLELVKLCQKAEHEYVGTRCGIMDQYTAVFGTAGHALMLDCRSLEYQMLPIPQDVRLVVCNSMVKHELASGEYNRRRADCEEAVKLLQPHLLGISALRDVAVADLEAWKQVLPATVYRRCRHVVTENQRVLAAAKALQSGDADRFGRLMYQSHASLRDDS